MGACASDSTFPKTRVTVNVAPGPRLCPPPLLRVYPLIMHRSPASVAWTVLPFALALPACGAPQSPAPTPPPPAQTSAPIPVAPPALPLDAGAAKANRNQLFTDLVALVRRFHVFSAQTAKNLGGRGTMSYRGSKRSSRPRRIARRSWSRSFISATAFTTSTAASTRKTTQKSSCSTRPSTWSGPTGSRSSMS